MQRVYQESQAEVPVDTGALKASGKIIIKKTRFGAEGEVTYGTDGDLRYALKVHEDLTANHPNGGKAKFLEDPMRREEGVFEENATSKLSKIFKGIWG